jgi:putative membrane-bound dehydrogenase-like protein
MITTRVWLATLLLLLAARSHAANPAYSKSPAGVDVSKEIPKSFPVEPQDAAETWVMKSGFKIQLVAHEPQLRDPIAICFDENGRMFAVEMIDHPESRETKPHLGRVSMLEDKDGDGRYETSCVFADDLPWPTGLIWANGGLYVLATPDIWHFQDKDGDGRAEVREKVFTGFGPGDNADALMNHPLWGLDNRIHLATGLRASGAVRCLKRPDLPAIELNGRDFWFDPRTHEFGLEATGAQYGISFDDYGRKFGNLNSEHLRHWIYEERYAQRNPVFTMPQPVQGIAVDGGAPEVFRISPDEPWRIVRNRWRVGGLSPGIIEGGGRVSGFLVAASGLTVYRGDAYGADFVGNVFVGDVGSQLVHRKVLTAAGASLAGRRAADEQASEFAASRDTWMRPVSFANAPDGCLHVVDMYREVCEISWAIPDEIKKHIDIRGGTDRGRIWRIVPDQPSWQRRATVALGDASTAELVALLEHPNGWHRDTAARLLYERQTKDAAPLLARLLRESKRPLARLHALGALDGLQALDTSLLVVALTDEDAHVRERGVLLAEKQLVRAPAAAPVLEKLAALADDSDERVRFQVALTLGTALQADSVEVPRMLAPAFVRLAKRDHAHAWIAPAVLSAAPTVTERHLFESFTSDARI